MKSITPFFPFLTFRKSIFKKRTKTHTEEILNINGEKAEGNGIEKDKKGNRTSKE